MAVTHPVDVVVAEVALELVVVWDGHAASLGETMSLERRLLDEKVRLAVVDELVDKDLLADLPRDRADGGDPSWERAARLESSGAVVVEDCLLYTSPSPRDS